MNSLVSIIIINFNGLHLLTECLESIQKSSYSNIETIIVDNGSSDGSIDFIKKSKIKNLGIKIIKNKSNLGFAQANNQGVKLAKGKYILLFNNDAVFEKNALSTLVLFLDKEEKIAVVQPKIIFYKSKRLQSGVAFLTPFGFLYYFGFGHNPDDYCYNKEIDMFSANGACMLIRKSVIDKVGLFDESFFAYYEETDFCHRILLSGFRITYIPKALVFHKGGQTSIRLDSPFVFFHSLKNRLNSSIKNFELKTLFFIFPSLILIYFLLFFVYILRGKLSMSRAVINAITWNISNLRGTLFKRNRIQQKIRIINDRFYLKKLLKNVSMWYYFNMLLDKEILLEKEEC